MPVQTRSSTRKTHLSAPHAAALPRSPTHHTPPPPRNTPPRARKPPRPRTRPPSSSSSSPTSTLQHHLHTTLTHTTSLRHTLASLTARLTSAEHNLALTKQHLRDATTQARESKRIICRYLELSMADIPPCKSLALPMDVYADESCGRLADAVREGEESVREMRGLVEGVKRKVVEGGREVGRLRRMVRMEKGKGDRKRVGEGRGKTGGKAKGGGRGKTGAKGRKRGA
ncbi:uncharacterized protein LTHEOB_4527 [Lasiodiplodia theobromae]|uniref:uncharacterized protein n=1 Tax=Lasiodiplodia theobromae TaxID=45133 RepID=UPI0015C3B34E|nr:uncharacterized protein LTHEOB_4527 [Lasiodiplodia theobromae]KAF4545875.1 hypothetical protein LTHEOB_4527 [Lasiodiplodia theobromae]